MDITAIVIDDEHKSLEILVSKIKRFLPDINIIGKTQSPEKGIALILELKPDLVFLDIAMPELSGFDLLNRIKEPFFELIFVTAFDSYAIDAIRHCAIGYLLKPINNEDLVNAVNNAEKNILAKSALNKNLTLLDNLVQKEPLKRKVAIPCNEGIVYIKIEDIIQCEGIEGYTKIHLTSNKEIVSSYSIGYYVKLMQNQDFQLTHKSHLVNMDHVLKYINEGLVVLSNGGKAPVSRNRRPEFVNLLRN